MAVLGDMTVFIIMFICIAFVNFLSILSSCLGIIFSLYYYVASIYFIRRAANFAVFSSVHWLLSDFPPAKAFQSFTFTDKCLFSLFHPVTMSCHGVPFLVCGCLQPQTDAADPQSERFLTNQSNKPHIPWWTRRGHCHLDRQ